MKNRRRIVRIFEEPEQQQLFLPGALVRPARGLRLTGTVISKNRNGKRLVVRWCGLTVPNTSLCKPDDLVLIENPNEEEEEI
jgi:hypothetical protein